MHAEDDGPEQTQVTGETVKGTPMSITQFKNRVYPSPEMMGKLFALEAMPLNIDRIRTGG